MKVDIRVCERLLSQMPESKVMEFRGKFHALISELYGELAATKAEIEEYEIELNNMEANGETNAQDSPEETTKKTKQ